MHYFLDATGFISKKSKIHLAKNANPTFKKLASYIKTVKSITTTDQYNIFIKKVISIFRNSKLFPAKQFPVFDKEIIAISKSAPLTEKTPWGGVVLKNADVEKDYIRKLLVIGKNGVLGFEIHKLKHERLKIIEGVCMVLYSNHSNTKWQPGKIFVEMGVPEDKFKFLTNDEHGIITLTKCVIEERSTNHLDDLVYIFPASQVK